MAEQTPLNDKGETESNPPFKVEYAARVHRLPPYLFGRINNTLYQKRRAGNDVIDLGMGNPSDPPERDVMEKMAEASAGVDKSEKSVMESFTKGLTERFRKDIENLRDSGQ